MEGGATTSEASGPHRSDVRTIFSNAMTLPKCACVIINTVHGIETKYFAKRDIFVYYTAINSLLIQVFKMLFVVVINVN